MANAFIIPPATFVEHSTKLRALKLEHVAAQVEQQLRIRLVPADPPARRPRTDLSSVLKHFRGRLR